MINDQAWLENDVHPDRAEARRGDHRGARPVVGGERGQRGDRPRPRLGATARRDGDWVSMGIPSDGSYGIPEGVHLRLPGHLQGRPVRDRQGHRDQRVQPQAHGRDAEGAARGARRRQAPARQWHERRRQASGKRLRRRSRSRSSARSTPTTRCMAKPRLPGALPLRRRRRRRLAGHARPRHLATWTTCSPTSGASPTSATCRCWSTSDTGFGASAFNVARTTRSLDQGRRRARCTSRTRSAPSAAATAPARRSSRRTRWCDRIKAAVDARTDRALRHHGAHRRAGRRGPGPRDRARR